MRIATILIGMILILPSGWSAEATSIGPELTISISPEQINETAGGETRNATFWGLVDIVNKPPVMRFVVVLTSSVSTGWPSECSPTSIVITDSSPHNYQLSVILPQNVSPDRVTVMVNAQAHGGGLTLTASARAVIQVTRSPLPQPSTNTTGTNTNTTGTVAPDEVAIIKEKVPMIMATVVVVGIVLGVGIGLARTRRKRKRRNG